jgi:ribonuclease HI
MIIIYTDGAARNNPGRGGYGAILQYGTHYKEISKGFLHTTNNRMELKAVIDALHLLKKPNQHITIYTDSQYVANAVNKGWLQKWIKTHFKGDKKNPDLWLEYNIIAQNHTIQFEWVKGHAENFYNNRCDELATMAADDRRNLVEDEGYGNEKQKYLALLNKL